MSLDCDNCGKRSEKPPHYGWIVQVAKDGNEFCSDKCREEYEEGDNA